MYGDRRDAIWINLKILAKLPPFHRLNTQNELFYIESNTIWYPASVLRWLRGDNRVLSIKRIDELICKGSELLKKMEDKEKENMLTHLIESRNGLNNLKQTYESDLTIIASIDRLLDKIHVLVPESESDASEEETGADCHD